MSSFFQNKPAGSAFGTPQNTNTFGSFGTPAASKPGPFSVGGTQPQTGTSTFGSPAQQQNTNTGGFGGFGGFGASTNQGTGGFGQSTQQNTGFGQSSNQGGFGQNPSNQGMGGFGGFGQKTGGFGSGFGASSQQQQQPNQGGFGGGFLGQGQQQPQQQQLQQQPAFGGSTFGGGAGFNTGSSVGGNTLGGSWLGSQQQQQQQQPQLIQQQSQITPITRWSDLPANDQKFLEDLEKYITEQKAICEDLKTRSPQLDEYVLSIPADVNEVQKRFDTISHILFVDMTLVANDLKVQFDLLSTQTQQTIRVLEVLTHPSASSLSYLASTHGAGGDSLIDYFLQMTIKWQGQVDSFKREIAEIDRMLKAVEDGQMGGEGGAGDEVLETIRAQWEGFCGLAARVGKIRERAAEVKIAVEKGLRGGRW